MFVRVVTPGALCVPVEDVTAQLRVDSGDDLAVIEAIIGAAQATIEGLTQRTITTATLQARLPSGPTWSGLIRLPRGPVRSIVEVSAGVPATAVLDSQYASHGDEGLVLNTGLTGDVLITYTAGDAPDAVSASMRQAVILQTKILYDQPEGPAYQALVDARDALLTGLCNWSI